MTPAPYPRFEATLVTLMGLMIGSFLNVCIYRLPLGKSIVWPASACPGCGRELAWYENIPVLSYAVLRGRCRSCGVRISPLYPAVELATGLLVAACVWKFGLTATSDEDIRTFAREPLGCRQPDAAIAAGDDRDLTVEFTAHQKSPN